MSHKALYYLHSQLSNVEQHMSDGSSRAFRGELWKYNWCDEDLKKRFPWWMHHHSLLDVAILTGEKLSKPSRRGRRDEPDDGLHKRTHEATIAGPGGKTAPISLRETSAFNQESLSADLRPIAEHWFGIKGALSEHTEADLIRWMVRDPDGPIVSTALLAWPETALYMLNYLSLDEGDCFNGVLPCSELKECFGMQADGEWLYQGVAHEKVDEEIASLPSCERITLSDRAHVAAARASYEALTSAQKELVKNIGMLEAAEEQISSLAEEDDEGISLFDDVLRLARRKNSDSNKDAVPEDVGAIPKETIAEWLERDLDLEASSMVDREISRIPTRSRIALTDEESVASVRESYEALTPAQKALIKRVAVLEGAEAKIAELRRRSPLQGFSMSRFIDYLWEDFGGSEGFNERLYKYVYSLGELCHILIGLGKSAETRIHIPRYERSIQDLPTLPRTFEESCKEQGRPNTSYAVLDLISALYIAAIVGPKPLADVLTAEVADYLNAATKLDATRDLDDSKQPIVGERIRPLLLSEYKYVDKGLREGNETRFDFSTQEIRSYKLSERGRHFSKHWQPDTVGRSFFALPGQTVVAGRNPRGRCGKGNAKLIPVTVEEVSTGESTLSRVQFEIGVKDGEWCLFDRGTETPYSENGILIVRDGHALHVQQYADEDGLVSFVGSEVWDTRDRAGREAFEFVPSGHSSLDELVLNNGVKLRAGDYIYLSPVSKLGTLMPDAGIHFFKVDSPEVPVGSWVTELRSHDG